MGLMIAGGVIVLIGLFVPMGTEDGHDERGTGLPYSQNRILARGFIVAVGAALLLAGFCSSS
jgi:hypothetical protein